MKPAICTQCGGNIEVDETKELGICKFCGTPFITERVINNYITKNEHNITNNITKIIYGNEKDEGEDFFQRALTFIDLEEWTNACDTINKAIKRSPEKSEYWFYGIIAQTKNLTTTESFFHDEYDRSYGSEHIYDNAKKFFKIATEENKRILGERFGFVLTSIESFIVDLLERIDAKERDPRLIGSLYGLTKWTESNKNILNRLYILALDAKIGLTVDNINLLCDETLNKIKQYSYQKDVNIYGNRASVRGYGAWLGEETVNLNFTSEITHLDLAKNTNMDKKVIIPTTVKEVYGVDLGINIIEVRGNTPSSTLINHLINCARPEILYLPTGVKLNLDRGLLRTSETPEKTVLVCSEPCKISVTFGTYVQGKGIISEKRLIGGIFAGKIFYPKANNINVLKAFNSNLKKHFEKEIEAGNITGFINDEDLDLNTYRLNSSINSDGKKTGFLARLFGRK